MEMLFLAAFITFQACRADFTAKPTRLTATDKYFTIRKSVIGGFENEPGDGAECVRIFTSSGTTRFVVGTVEEVKDQIDPESRAGR